MSTGWFTLIDTQAGADEHPQADVIVELSGHQSWQSTVSPGRVDVRIGVAQQLHTLGLAAAAGRKHWRLPVTGSLVDVLALRDEKGQNFVPPLPSSVVNSSLAVNVDSAQLAPIGGQELEAREEAQVGA